MTYHLIFVFSTELLLFCFPSLWFPRLALMLNILSVSIQVALLKIPSLRLKYFFFQEEATGVSFLTIYHPLMMDRDNNYIINTLRPNSLCGTVCPNSLRIWSFNCWKVDWLSLTGCERSYSRFHKFFILYFTNGYLDCRLSSSPWAPLVIISHPISEDSLSAAFSPPLSFGFGLH